MSAGEEPPRDPEEAAEDQATNELGFRNVDEEGDYDEVPGRQGAVPGDERPPADREDGGA